MKVTFTRTRERRYRVTIERERAARIVIEPAPGYHDYLPHDLLHYLVEAEAGIRYGVFGRYAAGADRTNDRVWKRLRTFAPDDVTRSERLAGLAGRAWDHGKVPVELEALQPRLRAAARRWHALPVGGSLSFEWPWPEQRVKATPQRRRERARPAPRH
jgi:hypothetical protein